jgi:hypothetical protein
MHLFQKMSLRRKPLVDPSTGPSLLPMNALCPLPFPRWIRALPLLLALMVCHRPLPKFREVVLYLLLLLPR